MFNDGVAKIYSVGDISSQGDMPKEGLTLKAEFRYSERTVGMGRFWSAQQAQAKIDLLLRVPKRREISPQDVAVPNDGHQYRIMQIQYPEGLDVMDLSLERIESEYEFS